MGTEKSFCPLVYVCFLHVSLIFPSKTWYYLNPATPGILLGKVKLKVLGLSQQRLGSCAVAQGVPRAQIP